MNQLSLKELSLQELKIINLRKQRPCYTLEQIGRKLGYSKERVRQILKANNQPTRHIKIPRLCSSCGKPITRGKTGLCFKCWAISHSVTTTCKICGKKFHRKESEILRTEFNFCSRKCNSKYLGKEYGWGSHSY